MKTFVRPHFFRLVVLLLLIGGAAIARGGPNQTAPPKNKLGDFEGHTDVGTNLVPGSATYDSKKHQYTVSGSGDDIWIAPDSFYFVWRRLDSDMTISADIAFGADNGQIYHKAGFMVRSGFGPNDPYVDAAVHGNGLTALQYRTESGAPTQEVRSTATAPKALRFERHGNVYSLFVLDADGKFQPSGTITVDLKGPLYVGLIVCSHDAKGVQTATFTNVQFKKSH